MANAKTNPKEIDALFIRTKHSAAAYRRAGFVFNRQGMGIALDALDKDQVKLLKADPHLIVEECTFPADEDAAAKAAAEAEAAKQAEADKAAAEAEAAKQAEADKAAAEAEAAKQAEADKAAAEAEAAKQAEADKAAAEAEAAKQAEADKAAADAKKQADKAGSAKGRGQ